MNRTVSSMPLIALATVLATPALGQGAVVPPSAETDQPPAHQTLQERRLMLKAKRAAARAERRQSEQAEQQAERRERITKAVQRRRAATQTASEMAPTEAAPRVETPDSRPAGATRVADGNRQAGAPAAADPTTDGSDPGYDIIVTALLRQESRADAAASTSVVTRESMDAQGGIGTQGELIDLLPGVNFADNGGVNGEITIRGAGGETSQSNDTDSAVAILRNGARVTGGNLSGKFFSRMDSFDLGQAEVVRGAQGALYGVNAVGGVVNLVSQKPKFRDGASVSVAYRPEVDEVVQNAVLNLAASRKLAFRFGYQGDQREGGFFLNRFNNQFGDSSNDQLGRASVYYRPNRDFSNYTVVDYEFQRTPPGPVKTAGASDLDGPFIYGHNTPDNATKREFSFNNNLEWRIGGLGKLTSITAYRWRNTSVLTDADNSYVGYLPAPAPSFLCSAGLCTRSDNDDTRIMSEELRLDINGSRRFDLIVGGNIQYTDTKSFTLSDGRATSRTNPAPNGTRNNSVVSNRSETQIGLFASAQWKPFDGFTVDASARYNRSDKSGASYTVVRTSPTVPTATCNYTDPEGVANPSTDPCVTNSRQFGRVFENVQPTIAVRYLIQPGWTVFGSFSRGHRPGGFNPNSASDPTIPAEYNGETTNAYEVGTNIKFGRMLLNLAGFINDYDDLIVIGFAPTGSGDPDDPTAYYRFNAGTARSYGFDAQLSGYLPIPSSLGTLQFDGSINYVTGKINTGPYAGQRYEGSPEWTTTISSIWTKPLSARWKLVGSASYRGEHGGYAKTSQTLNSIIYPPKDTLKLRLALENPWLRFEVAADNVLDSVYPTRVTPQSSIFADRRILTFRVTYALGSEARRR